MTGCSTCYFSRSRCVFLCQCFCYSFNLLILTILTKLQLFYYHTYVSLYLNFLLSVIRRTLYLRFMWLFSFMFCVKHNNLTSNSVSKRDVSKIFGSNDKYNYKIKGNILSHLWRVWGRGGGAGNESLIRNKCTNTCNKHN